jgi:predicted ATP-dependent serine protease
MATLKRVTSYICGECGEKIIAIRHRCPVCRVAFNNVENFTYAQHAKETPLPIGDGGPDGFLNDNG